MGVTLLAAQLLLTTHHLICWLDNHQIFNLTG